MARGDQFSGRWGLIAAALGMAIGTGNIWRFPRVAAANGGGAFLIPWLLFLFLWSVPLLLVELGMGRRARKGTIGAFGALLGRGRAWMGAFVGLCTLLIMFYYSVVAGWCFRYLVGAFASHERLAEDAAGLWAASNSGPKAAVFHLAAVVICALIVIRGIARGVEIANKLLLPLLTLMLIACAIRAITLPGALQGLEFLFDVRWEYLGRPQTWLEALSQSAWSTGAGWGLMLTYAVYVRREQDIALSSLLTGLGNNAASLLCAMAILPAVYALTPTQAAAEEVLGSGSQGLAFVWIPALLSRMPAGGQAFSVLFFLAMSFAAISSLISMMELGSRLLMDAGFARTRAVLAVATTGALLGLPSAMSHDIFNNQDWVWGLGLALSGALFATAVILYGPEKFRTECIDLESNDFRIGRWFSWLVALIIPLEFIAMMVWWLGRSIGSDGWWNPLSTSSVGTVLTQWTILIVLCLIVGRWLYGRTKESQ